MEIYVVVILGGFCVVLLPLWELYLMKGNFTCFIYGHRVDFNLCPLHKIRFPLHRRESIVKETEEGQRRKSANAAWATALQFFFAIG